MRSKTGVPLQVRDMDGRLVEVEVASGSLADIRTSRITPAGVSGTAGQTTPTVSATVVSITQETNRVKVQTHEDQTLVLTMPPETLANLQVGQKLTLVVPR